MHIDWWTLGLQAVNAVVLIWLLSRFLFKPVAAIIAERQAAAAKVGADAAAIKATTERDRASIEAMEADMAADRARQIKAATAAAEEEHARLIAAARAEADQIRTEAQADVEKLKAEAIDQAHARAAELAMRIAERLMTRLPRAMLIAPFLPELGEAIDALPPQTRKELAESPSLRTARELEPTERKAINDLLADKLGAPVAPATEVDPAVIAGIELESPHAAVRNSLRVDLDHIAEELARDGR